MRRWESDDEMLELVWLAVRDSASLFILGWLGWRLLERWRVPAASFLGGLCIVGLVQVLGFEFTNVPTVVKLVLQIILGTFIGLRFSRETWLQMKEMAWPVLLVSGWMLASCFVVGLVFFRLTAVTPITAILGAAPAGLAEMTMLALSMDADAVVVIILQLMRILGILVVIPFLALRQVEGPLPEETQVGLDSVAWDIRGLRTLLIGTVGGLMGYWLNWPAAGLLGALVTVGLTSSFYSELPPLPQQLRVWAQVGIGSLIGLNFSSETLGQLGGMLLPVITTTAALLGSGLVLAAVLKRITHWDNLTCLLASAPGGVTQFFILACELGADPLKVSLLQMARLLAILILLPLLLRLPLW
ncbi:MAG: AbrB family transcriptional regulator [bacterium]|jgi:membrane AbrB-like protein